MYAPPAPIPPPATASGGGLAKTLSVVAVLLAVVALAANFVMPGPQGIAGAPGQDGTDGAAGATGPVGPTGATGATGAQGPAGADGPAGPQGPAGADGINCWDLNGNGVPDVATEDLNGDTNVDVNDCTGAQGPVGPGAIVQYSQGTATGLTAVCVQVSGASVTLSVPDLGTAVVTATVRVRLEHTLGSPDQVVLLLSRTSADCTYDAWRAYYTVVTDEPTGQYIHAMSVQEPFAIGSAGTYTFYLNALMVTGASAADAVTGAAMIAVFYPA